MQILSNNSSTKSAQPSFEMKFSKKSMNYVKKLCIYSIGDETLTKKITMPIHINDGLRVKVKNSPDLFTSSGGEPHIFVKDKSIKGYAFVDYFISADKLLEYMASPDFIKDAKLAIAERKTLEAEWKTNPEKRHAKNVGLLKEGISDLYSKFFDDDVLIPNALTIFCAKFTKDYKTRAKKVGQFVDKFFTNK